MQIDMDVRHDGPNLCIWKQYYRKSACRTGGMQAYVSDIKIYFLVRLKVITRSIDFSGSRLRPFAKLFSVKVQERGSQGGQHLEKIVKTLFDLCRSSVHMNCLPCVRKVDIIPPLLLPPPTAPSATILHPILHLRDILNGPLFHCLLSGHCFGSSHTRGR